MTESQVDAYVKATDEAADFVTHQAESLQQRALEDIDDLYRNVGERDPELWDELEAEPETTIEEYEAEEERDLGWILGVSAMSAAALTQFAMDNARSLIFEPVAYKEQLLGSYNFSRGDLVRAGRRGAVGYADEAVTQFQAIQSRYIDDVLTPFVRMNTVDLFRTLRDYGALPTESKLIGDASGYVARMTNYRPGSVQFKQAVNNLLDQSSGRALKGINREAVRSIYTEREANGDLDTLMVWMGEGGKNTCGFCLDQFGVIKTYSQWQQDGMPGADICAGGMLCKCSLHAVLA